jgi:phosphatidylserine/phosphatidylglycerophosphate/cardiolipin synthase-like enzyme
MKKSLLILLLVCPLLLRAQTSPFADIEIVESIPIGTTLDNPDIRNAHEVWLEMIGHAQKALDIEQFYISNEPGKLLEDVLSAIYQAASRGVKVRIIVDARMYKTYPGSVDSLGRCHNIETRRIDFGAAGGGIQHAKYFIVDGNEVFMGSQNFDWRALEHIHELGLRIKQQKIAQTYSDVFELDWQIASMSQEQVKLLKVPTRSFGPPVRFTARDG